MKNGSGWFKAFIGLLGVVLLAIVGYAYERGVRDASRDAKLENHDKRITKVEQMKTSVDSLVVLMTVQAELKKREKPIEYDEVMDEVKNNNTKTDTSSTNEFTTDYEGHP